MKEIREGKAVIELSQNVFYNRVQEFNRDISIFVIRRFQKEYLHANRKEKKIKILEGLSASGLRAIRYAKEIENVECVYANDLDPNATEIIKKNMAANGLEEKIVPTNKDVNLLMAESPGFFDVIDLDPYGSASPFIEAAVRSVADGGLLCVTCTDGAVLCGKNPETSFTRYGGTSLKTPFCHEMGLRLMLSSLATAAGRHRRTIVPLLSLSIDFYFRVFLRIVSSPKQSKSIPLQIGPVSFCAACSFFATMPFCEKKDEGISVTKGFLAGKCPFCGSRPLLGGPVWLGSLHNKEFLSGVSEGELSLQTKKRIAGMVDLATEELSIPFFIDVSRLSHIFLCTTPSLADFRSALINCGYFVSSTHTSPYGVKTDAPFDVVFNVMREHIRRNPTKKQTVAVKALLDGLREIPVSFEPRDDGVSQAKKQRLVRYQQNPEPNWGPKKRA
eukprot:GHVN01100855.1.p2 GENE.GHVN01100855.1~~GHVN01100855.1.p2  ORF type:complete len:445 (+),score=45.07 GHVN01100855.1:2383-3717(+)